jgi:tight adherence protein B
MSAVLGLVFGVGLLLVTSPFLWPRAAHTRRPPLRLWAFAKDRLAEAGLERVGPGVLLGLSALSGVAAVAAAQAATGVTAIALTAGAAGLALPAVLVSRRAHARRRRSRVVWPDIVDHLVASVRSGLALPDAVGALGRVGPAATRAPFAEFERDYRATGSFSPCIDRLKERLADPTADRVLETLRMAREVGGTELTAVLGSLATSLRESAAARSEVEARQSWVVNAARLGVAAPWIVLLLLASRPEAARAYDSPAGAIVVITGLGLSVVAYRIMLSLGRIRDEKRSFR